MRDDESVFIFFGAVLACLAFVAFVYYLARRWTGRAIRDSDGEQLCDDQPVKYGVTVDAAPSSSKSVVTLATPSHQRVSEPPVTEEPAETIGLRQAWRRSYLGIVSVLIFTALINALKLAIPLYTLQILDRVLSSRSLDTLIMLTFVAVGALITGALLEFIRRLLLIRWGVWIERVFARRLVHAGLAGRVRGQASEMLRDLTQLRQFLGSATVLAWLDIAYVPAFIVIVWLINPLFVWVIFGVMAAMLALGVLNEWLSRSSRSAATRAGEDGNLWLTTLERDAEGLGSPGVTGNLADRWQESSEMRLEENLTTRTIALAIVDAMRFLETFQRIAIYGLGVWQVIAGEMTVGGVVASAIIARIAIGTFRRAMSGWRNLTSSRAAYRRVKKWLTESEPAPLPTKSGDEPAALVLEDLNHRYGDRSIALFRHLNVILRPGEALCIVGRSGSGKTTLARIISGQLAPRSGMVRLGGVDVLRHRGQAVTNNISILPQDVQLFAGTIRDNISGLNDHSDDEVIAAARMAGIHDTIIRLPFGYETEVQTIGLSAGERKRVALARTFIGRPAVVVMDEPEAHLDEESRRPLSEAIVACKAQGSIVIVTSQTLDLTRVCEKGIVLDREANRGAIVYDDNEALKSLRRGARKSRPRIVAAASKSSGER